MRLQKTWWIVVLVWLMSGSVLASAPKKEEGEGEGAGASEYIALTPAVVANYGGGAGGMRYMKADIALRVPGGPAVQSAVIHHLPYVRHVLVMLLSDQTEESLSSMEGKEQLRHDALLAVQKIFEEEEGKPLVEDLLFNSFVVQR